ASGDVEVVDSPFAVEYKDAFRQRVDKTLNPGTGFCSLSGGFSRGVSISGHTFQRANARKRQCELLRNTFDKLDLIRLPGSFVIPLVKVNNRASLTLILDCPRQLGAHL